MVVVGGGITGAGVALDAASRGYSVALLERADFASGTSSRSSKLVHGGLRYLQNFDLGLVREALLERQLMVALAPHLVRPLPLVVPAFDGAQPDRLVGVGLNLYDVMAVERDRLRGRRARRKGEARNAAERAGVRDRRGRRPGVLEPGAPPRDLRRGGGRAAAGARRARADLRLPLLRLPDRRRAARADRARRGRALRRGVRQPARRDRPARGRRPRQRRRACATSRRGEEFEVRRPTSSTRPACGPTSCAPRSCTTRPSCRSIRPSRGTHITLAHDDLPLIGGAIVPAGGGRSIFALPWLGHTLIGTTDNDYEGPLEHVEPSERGHRLPARRHQRVLRLGLRPRPADRRVRGRAAADLDRRPEEVGRHLAQGRAVRDLLGDDHDHRRQAHDLAADGEDDRRPARRARSARRALPHARDPARAGDRAGGAAARRGRRAGGLRGARRRATATPRTRCSRSPPSAASWPSRSSPAARTCSPRSRSRPATSRRAASATCCCAARASGCSPRASCWPTRRPMPVRRVGEVLARELGWDEQRLQAELDAFAEEAAAEGIAVGARGARALNAPRRRLRAGGRELELGERPLLMGIVNASPDSFSDGGRAPRRSTPRWRWRASCSPRAPTSIDVGGESASTGRPPVAAAEEIERVVPLIERLAGELGALVSVDTYKPAVARAAIAAGARIVNDVSGLRDPGARRRSAPQTGAALVRHAHARRAARTPAGPRPLRRRRRRGARVPARAHRGRARAPASQREQLIVDPGPDFAKTPAQTIGLLARVGRAARARPPAADGDLAQGLHRRADRARAARAPAPARSPRSPTASTQGAHIFRVHDVGAAGRLPRVRAALRGRDARPGEAAPRSREEIRYSR